MSTIGIFISIEPSKEAEERKIVSKIEQLKELEELIKEAEAEAEVLKNEIKNEMLKRNTEEMSVGRYVVRNTEVLSSRFDTKNFKRLFPNMYKDFTKEVTSRRFSISG